MNYTRIYESLISRAKARDLAQYKERHHIIPECFFKNRKRKGPPGHIDGNPNDKNNLVYLTAEEHFLAHQLLVKIYPNDKRMIYALHCMSISGKGNIRNNKEYSWIKKQVSVGMSGKNNPNFGKILSQEQKDHLSLINTGKVGSPGTPESKIKRQKTVSNKKANGWSKPPVTDATRNNISKATKGKSKSPFTEEHKTNLSISKTGKISKKRGKPVKTAKTLVSIKTPFGNFISYADAGRQLNIDRFTIRTRCHSKNFTDWEIIDQCA